MDDSSQTAALLKPAPEPRRFRNAVTAVYVALGIFLCSAATVSSCRGAHARMGVAPAPASRASVDDQALALCMGELEALSAELNRHLDVVLGRWPVTRNTGEWEDWSTPWHQRLLEVGARCRLEEGDVPAAANLAEAWRSLKQLHRQYTTLVIQLSNEIGPWAERLNQAMEKARRSSPPAR